jgi:hypothetical protein
MVDGTDSNCAKNENSLVMRIRFYEREQQGEFRVAVSEVQGSANSPRNIYVLQ